MRELFRRYFPDQQLNPATDFFATLPAIKFPDPQNPRNIITFPEEHFFDAPSLQRRIQALSRALTVDPRSNKIFIGETEIVVNVFSCNVPCISLVDLPGLIENYEDDMDASCPETTKKLAQKYAEQPHNVLVAVVASTSADRDGMSREAGIKVCRSSGMSPSPPPRLPASCGPLLTFCMEQIRSSSAPCVWSPRWTC